MGVTTESALRILLRRRNLHGSLRDATRQLIHQSIARIRASVGDPVGRFGHG
ncbi:MAG TPA: hypothetical protein VNU48_04845 [Burkholderiaceae bacterium]|nr:hypothetical protein [Burkholderiaceae bacterium]